MSWLNLDLIFDLALVTMAFIILSGLYHRNCKTLVRGVGAAYLQYYSVTFDLGSARMFSTSIFSNVYPFTKIYGLLSLIIIISTSA